MQTLPFNVHKIESQKPAGRRWRTQLQ